MMKRMRLPYPLCAVSGRDHSQQVYAQVFQSVSGQVADDGALDSPMTLVLANDLAASLSAFSFEMLRERLGHEASIRDAFLRDGTTTTFWHHLLWAKSGRLIYRVPPDLIRDMRHTDLDAVQIEDIELPTRSIFLATEDSGITVYHADSGEHDLDGFFVSEIIDRVGGRALSVCAVGRGTAQGVLDNALVTFSLPLDGSKTLAEWMTLAESDAKNEIAIGPNSLRVRDWAQIVLGLVLLIRHEPEAVVATPDEGVPEVKLRHARTIASTKHREAWLARYRLQAHVHVLAPDRPQDLAETETGTGAPLAVRSLVRGHWRRQAHGPGRSLRRVRWIRPFWRGPDTGPEVSTAKVVRL